MNCPDFGAVVAACWILVGSPAYSTECSAPPQVSERPIVIAQPSCCAGQGGDCGCRGGRVICCNGRLSNCACLRDDPETTQEPSPSVTPGAAPSATAVRDLAARARARE